MQTWVVACLVLVSCAKKPTEHDVAQPTRPIDAPAPTQVVIAGSGSSAGSAAPAAAAPVAKPDACQQEVRAIMSSVRSAYIAMNAGPPRKEAVTKWPTIAPPCQDGQWYLAAALLVNLGETELTAGSVKVTSEESALTAALTKPDDIDVLERVALVSTLGRAPKLPDDACKRAKNAIGANPKPYLADAAHYVCARAAIAAADGATAKQELDAIKSSSDFVDIALARAQAAKLTKDTKTMKAQAKLAMKLTAMRATTALLKEVDRKALIALAKPLAK
jgi:hypothetical protein